MPEDAIVKSQIALDNDTEVYLSRVEQIESSLDQNAKHYSKLLASTDNLEAQSDEFLAAKKELEELLASLGSIERAADKLDVIADELDRYCTQLEESAKARE